MKLTYEQIRDKEWCADQYITQEKSMNQIRAETGLGINTIKRWFKKHNINIRSSDDKVVCEQKSHKLRNHPQWKGKRNNCGYSYIYHPKHPNSPRSGYISEHRFIAEQIIGRVLDVDEFVHHIDMDKTNNKIENLYIAKQVGHKKTHASFNRLCKKLMEMGVVVFNQKEGIYEIL